MEGGQAINLVVMLQLMPLDLLLGCCSHIFNEMRLFAHGQKSHPCPSLSVRSFVHPGRARKRQWERSGWQESPFQPRFSGGPLDNSGLKIPLKFISSPLFRVLILVIA